VGDSWEWKIHNEHPGFSYLVKRGAIHKPNTHSQQQIIEQGDEDRDVFDLQTLRDNSDETILESDVNIMHIYEYHILFSTAYRVPVLYFNGYKADGSMLSLEDIWDNLPKKYKNEDIISTFLTQKEHPALLMPFFHIHPCETSKLMEDVLSLSIHPQHKRDYLLSWLSIVGPVVSLYLPLSYYTLT